MRTFGFLIDRDLLSGTEYVTARIVGRDGEKEYPHNAVAAFVDDWPKHLQGLELDGLTLTGHVYDVDRFFILGAPRFKDAYSVELIDARRMVRTLSRLADAIQKADAREPGDVMTAVAKSLKLSFVVERKGASRGGMYSNSDWHWMTLTEGRNRYRELIERAKADTQLRSEKVA